MKIKKNTFSTSVLELFFPSIANCRKLKIFLKNPQIDSPYCTRISYYRFVGNKILWFWLHNSIFKGTVPWWSSLDKGLMPRALWFYLNNKACFHFDWLYHPIFLMGEWRNCKAYPHLLIWQTFFTKMALLIMYFWTPQITENNLHIGTQQSFKKLLGEVMVSY
jgi:hypothetical protein